MRDYQTPQKDQPRSSDLANRKSQLKKPHKIAKKSLNGVFTSVSEDAKESIGFSPVSEISVDDHDGQISVSSVLALNKVLSASSETFSLSDVTPTSNITDCSDDRGDVSVEPCEFNKPDGSSMIGTVEADIVVNLLKQARTQVLKSTDADRRSKKLLDALIALVIDELYSLPEERDRYAELVSMKGRIVFLCFMLWIVAVSVIFFPLEGLDSSFSGLPST